MTKPRPSIRPAAPPSDSLIAAYAARPSTYTDAYCACVSGAVDLSTYLRAFYGSSLFAAERRVLAMAGHRSSETDIVALADGHASDFAAWTVENRRAHEILLRDVSGRTGSWLSVEASDAGTRLWFGSAVLPPEGREAAGIGPVFTALLGVHRLYSKTLLRAALRNLPERSAA